MRRREIMEAAGGAGLLAIAAACFAKAQDAPSLNASPDAELVRLCQQAQAAHSAVIAVNSRWSHMRGDSPEYKAGEADYETAYELLQGRIDSICSAAPHTTAGHAAMAKLVLFIAKDYEPINDDDDDTSLSYVPRPLVETILYNLAGGSA